MALVKPDVGRFARIKVIGVGGGGGNAVNSMIGGDEIGVITSYSIHYTKLYDCKQAVM